VQVSYERDHDVVELAPNVNLVHCAENGSSEDDCRLYVTRSKQNREMNDDRFVTVVRPIQS
jgi:hypothetical protein